MKNLLVLWRRDRGMQRKRRSERESSCKKTGRAREINKTATGFLCASGSSAFRKLQKQPENREGQKYLSSVNELCVLRRRLHSEQRRLEEQLLQTEWEHFPSPFTDRHRTDVFEMARLGMPVRGPSTRGTEPISSKGADDIMYRDAFMPLPRTQQSRKRDVEGGTRICAFVRK